MLLFYLLFFLEDSSPMVFTEFLLQYRDIF